MIAVDNRLAPAILRPQNYNNENLTVTAYLRSFISVNMQTLRFDRHTLSNPI